MRVEVFHFLPDAAKRIRQAVFVDEQGFRTEFDGIDSTAVHLLLFDDSDTAIATCRVFAGEESGSYILGRLAVTKVARGNGVGRLIVGGAEEYVRSLGGKEIRLHAQCRVSAFYERLGYVAFGEVGDEEGCPHIWMKKPL